MNTLRPRSMPSRARACLSTALFLLVVSCAGGPTRAQAPPPPPTSADLLDGDPVALLPPGTILTVTIDARAFYEGRSFGADIGLFAEKFLPLTAEAGFSPSRDLDRVVVGTYSLESADVIVVARGRFDPAQVVRVAAGALDAIPYADHQMYTVGGFAFTVLTPHTVLVGTASGLRRALDRIHDQRIKVELSPWVVETLEAKDAAFALAGDFAGAPLAGLRGLPLPSWIGGVRAIRAKGDFRDPGVNVTGTVTFDDASHASAGADAIRQLGTFINTLAAAGVVPQLKNLTVGAEGPGVRCAFAVDEAPVHAFLKQLPQWLGRAH